MATLSSNLTTAFTTKFGATATPTIHSFAPGRLNFIGEHVDYLGGHVVPSAIDFGCHVMLSTTTTNDDASSTGTIQCAFASLEVDVNSPPATFTASPTAQPPLNAGKSLMTIASGAVYEALKLSEQFAKTAADTDGIATPLNKVTAINGLISSTIPIGAGLSSSAALCVALIQAVVKAVLPKDVYASVTSTADVSTTPQQLSQRFHSFKNAIARAAQRVENLYCGTNCGIMDQYASIHGKADTILEVDCSEMTHAAVPLFSADVGGYQVFLVNSMRAHDLGSNYNEVRADLAAGEAKINAYMKANGITLTSGTSDSAGDDLVTLREMAGKTFSNGLTAPALIDCLLAGSTSVDAKYATLTPREQGRCRYAVTEMERVTQFVSLAGSSSDLVAKKEQTSAKILQTLGELLSATHDGLANQLLVSTEEIDAIVAICRSLGTDKVYGARIMGGGFGGCVLALVSKDDANTVEGALREQFEAKFPELGACAVYKVALCDGAFVTTTA